MNRSCRSLMGIFVCRLTGNIGSDTGEFWEEFVGRKHHEPWCLLRCCASVFGDLEHLCWRLFSAVAPWWSHDYRGVERLQWMRKSCLCICAASRLLDLIWFRFSSWLADVAFAQCLFLGFFLCTNVSRLKTNYYMHIHYVYEYSLFRYSEDSTVAC